MSTPDEQILDICGQIKALQRRVAELPVEPNRSNTRQIVDLFVPGEGLLAKLRPSPALGLKKRTLGRSRKDRERTGEEGDDSRSDDDSDSDTDDSLDEDLLNAGTHGGLDEDALDDPSSKGRLGEDNALEYLRSLSNTIVSPSFRVGSRPSSDANDLLNHRQKDSKYSQ